MAPANARAARLCSGLLCLCVAMAGDLDGGRCCLANICFPRNTSIFFMGDSITRYQYLDLAYSLRFGADNSSWYARKRNNPTHYKTWCGPPAANSTKAVSCTRFAYMRGAMEELAPYEWCDCHPVDAGGFRTGHLIENRYFHSPACDVNVSFMQVLGSWNVEGHLHGPYGLQPAKDHAALSAIPRKLKMYRQHRWNKRWERAISEVVALHRPDVLILNSGLWPTTLVNYTAVREAAERASACVVWKTTTARRAEGGAMRGSAPTDDIALRTFADAAIFDAGQITEGLQYSRGNRSMWVDDAHFAPLARVYHELNLRLFDALYGRQAGGQLNCPRGRHFS